MSFSTPLYFFFLIFTYHTLSISDSVKYYRSWRIWDHF